MKHICAIDEQLTVKDAEKRNMCKSCKEKATESYAKCLFANGHTIEELIEIFSDPQEKHDLYTNSALVHKDFETLIGILEQAIK